MANKNLNSWVRNPRSSTKPIWFVLLLVLPLVLAMWILGLRKWELSIPLMYGSADHIWQLTLNKMLYETGWVLTNPFLGAPGIASWHHNAAAQTSALHSILMLGLSPLVSNAIQLQQIYYLLNFPLICVTTFFACRLLNVARLPALCAGMLFSFTKFRIDEMLYSYIPNYFMVPLAITAIVWTMRGDLTAGSIPSQPFEFQVTEISRRRKYWLGFVFIAFMAISDGYYSFFTLLLLGLAVTRQFFRSGWKRPLYLLPGISYIALLLTLVLALQAPLFIYKKSHQDEFQPNGVPDPVLIKHPFEAEVYSSSFKLLIAPNQEHHIGWLRSLGKEMVSSSDEARKYERGNYWPLGLLGSFLLVTSLLLMAFPAIRNTPSELEGLIPATTPQPPLQGTLTPLILFTFLASISGGIGTLVALLFPTIRAYDRFPAFLMFLLLLGAARYVSLKMENKSDLNRIAWKFLVVIIAVLALYDQIPRNSRKGTEQTAIRFKAEKVFVEEIEQSVPPGSMIYQYPYSQYLTNNSYYGWGSFSHIRLFLHSKALRWSNGGAKNSAADDWNSRLSMLSFGELLSELEATGFKGIVIDRTVVRDAEFAQLQKVLLAKGVNVREDKASNLSFARLTDPGFNIVYEPNYKEIRQLNFTNSIATIAGPLPRGIDQDALKKYLSNFPATAGTVISRTSRPEIFIDSAALYRGFGQQPVIPLADMAGMLRCEMRDASTPEDAVVAVTLTNNSGFDWKLNEGNYPIRIGAHVLTSDKKTLRWDNGFRVSASAFLKRGASLTTVVPISQLALASVSPEKSDKVLEFALLQEANAWFSDVSCTVPLK